MSHGHVFAERAASPSKTQGARRTGCIVLCRIQADNARRSCLVQPEFSHESSNTACTAALTVSCAPALFLQNPSCPACFARPGAHKLYIGHDSTKALNNRKNGCNLHQWNVFMALPLTACMLLGSISQLRLVLGSHGTVRSLLLRINWSDWPA